ncbi:DUF489 family protein, partial [Escherichia coli]
GSPAVLQSPPVQATVRATQLAGIRAAALWHPLGGGRLQLMVSRNRLTTQATHLLAHFPPALGSMELSSLTAVAPVEGR